MASRFRSLLRSHLLAAISHYRSSTQSKTPFISLLESPLLNSPSDLSPILIDSPFSISGIRHLSTLRRQPVRSRTVDIGARARQLQHRRLWTYALTFSGIAGFIIIVLNNFQDQMVFYVTPTDALEKFAQNPAKSRFRLGGLVLDGSVVEPASSPEMEFVITDLITDILVKYQGSLPDLFREGHSVVVEGFVRPIPEENREGFFSSVKVAVSEKARSGECYFSATEVLAKHDEKYMPKEVAVAIERNKAKIEADNEELKKIEKS